MRKSLTNTGIVIIGLIILLLLLKLTADLRYFANYDPKLPFKERVAEFEERPEYRRIKLYFQGGGGDQVPTLLTFPPKFQGKVPCIIFLHGIGQKKEFLDQITTPFNQHGFAIATFDQYMQGERKIVGGVLKQAMAFRQRPAKTVNDTRRLIDYLSTHPDVDANRIYVVGASYGAITGSTAAAFDERIRAIVLVYGGGNINRLLEAPIIAKELGRWLPVAKLFAQFYLWPADPIRYVDRIAPRPVLFQNGRYDALVAPAAAEALQNAAGEPKKITWYNSDHIGMDEDVVRQVLDEALRWLLEQDQPYR